MKKIHDKKFFKQVEIVIGSVIGNDFKNNEIEYLFEILETKTLTTTNIQFLYQFYYYYETGKFENIDKRTVKSLIYINKILNKYFVFEYTDIFGVINAVIYLKEDR